MRDGSDTRSTTAVTTVTKRECTVPPATGTAATLRNRDQVTIPALCIGLPIAPLDASGNPLNGTGVVANCWPELWLTLAAA